MIKTIVQNKKAYHDYFIEDTFEAGIALCGSEVKSVRLNNVNLKDSYAVAKFFLWARTYRLTKRAVISTPIPNECAGSSCTKPRY